jgi:hypothetical protein
LPGFQVFLAPNIGLFTEFGYAINSANIDVFGGVDTSLRLKQGTFQVGLAIPL